MAIFVDLLAQFNLKQLFCYNRILLMNLSIPKENLITQLQRLLHQQKCRFQKRTQSPPPPLLYVHFQHPVFQFVFGLLDNIEYQKLRRYLIFNVLILYLLCFAFMYVILVLICFRKTRREQQRQTKVKGNIKFFRDLKGKDIVQ